MGQHYIWITSCAIQQPNYTNSVTQTLKKALFFLHTKAIIQNQQDGLVLASEERHSSEKVGARSLFSKEHFAVEHLQCAYTCALVNLKCCW